jgi:hypothetical protein
MMLGVAVHILALCVDRVEYLRLVFVDLAHGFERVVHGAAWLRRRCRTKGTGMRRKATSFGTVLIQASSAGSKSLQCGQLYEKNSTTSILPAGASTGTRLSSTRYSEPALGARAWAWAGLAARDSSPSEVAASEKSRRFH